MLKDTIIYYEIREIITDKFNIINRLYKMKELKFNKIDVEFDFSIVKDIEHTFKIDKECYECTVVRSEARDYIYIYLKHGSNSPYDSKVTHVETFIKTENKNSEKEALLVKQIFFIINTNNNLLYSSVSSKHKDKIVSLLSKSVDIDISAIDKDSKLQKVFNTDILYESIAIMVDYNNGMFDEKDVYNRLKKEIDER